MRRRYIEGSGWDWLEVYSSKFKHIDEELSGYLSYIKIESVRNKHIVQIDKREICLADDGYIWFAFMPDNQNWSMTEMIDDKGNIIEWYFDVTRSNSIDKDGRPFIDDLYLDVVLLPNNKIIVLDEDEIKEALEQEKITKSEYEGLFQIPCKLRNGCNL